MMYGPSDNVYKRAIITPYNKRAIITPYNKRAIIRPFNKRAIIRPYNKRTDFVNPLESLFMQRREAQDYFRDAQDYF